MRSAGNWGSTAGEVTASSPPPLERDCCKERLISVIVILLTHHLVCFSDSGHFSLFAME